MSLPNSNNETKTGETKELNMKDIIINTHTEEDEYLRQLAPQICEDSIRWWLIFTFCCLFSLILPLCVFLTLSIYMSSSYYWPFIIVMIVLLSLGFIYFIYTIRDILLVIISPTPPPEPTAPLITNKEDTPGIKSPFKTKVKKVIILCNPYSGNKLGMRSLDTALSIFKQNNIECQVNFSQHRGHIKDLAKNLDLNGYDAMVVIGGDGSYSEMINGLLNREDKVILPIGFIPGGTGNSLLMDFGIGINVELAIQRIIDGDVDHIDIMHVHDQGSLDVYMLNTLCVGAAGDVGILANDIRCVGGARYDICAVWQICKLNPCRVEIVYDKKETIVCDTITTFFNNNQYFGKKLRGAPKAQLNDGLMDCCAVPMLSRGKTLSLFLQLPNGSHIYDESVKIIQCKEAELNVIKPSQDTQNSSPTKGLVNIDGDAQAYTGTISLRSIHQALPVFIPSNCESC